MDFFVRFRFFSFPPLVNEVVFGSPLDFSGVGGSLFSIGGIMVAGSQWITGGDSMWIVLGGAALFILGAVFGSFLGYFVALSRQRASFYNQISQLEVKMATLSAELANKKNELFEKSKNEQSLKDQFRLLSAQVLEDSNRNFFKLAESKFSELQAKAQGDLQLRQQSFEVLVKPIGEKLKEFDSKIYQIEKDRVESFATLNKHLSSLGQLQHELSREARQLSKALGTPKVRGNWAEIQLRRVVELAGMINYCDFKEQHSVDTGDGNRLQPDMVIKLPGNKTIIVDAKCPDTAFRGALNSENDEDRKRLLQDHARLVKNHISNLSSKSYWSQFDSSPEFVFMFLPSESAYNAALEGDGALIEFAANEKVIVATPTSLIALLKAVHFGWRQEGIAENAKLISSMGLELFERMQSLCGHFAKVGSSLESAVTHYNGAIGSLESRVLVSLRKFRELGVTNNELKSLEPIALTSRKLEAIE